MPTMTRGAGKAKSAQFTAEWPNAQDVARVAYELFKQRGGVHGHDQEDWFEAERIVQERKRSGSQMSRVRSGR